MWLALWFVSEFCILYRQYYEWFDFRRSYIALTVSLRNMPCFEQHDWLISINSKLFRVDFQFPNFVKGSQHELFQVVEKRSFRMMFCIWLRNCKCEMRIVHHWTVVAAVLFSTSANSYQFVNINTSVSAALTYLTMTDNLLCSPCVDVVLVASLYVRWTALQKVTHVENDTNDELQLSESFLCQHPMAVYSSWQSSETVDGKAWKSCMYICQCDAPIN